MTDDFDFIVIGGGSAGYAGAATAAGLGLKTAVIEGGNEVGGLCILRGCMPSKTLLESAHRAESIRRAGEFGLRAEYFGADAGMIRARKRRLIAEFADYRRQQLEDGRFEFIRGRAAFADEHHVEVQLRDGSLRRLHARTFLIATGSVIHRIEIPGLAETGFVTSDDVLDADRIPESIVVLGGGAIALELASFYAGVGSKVTVIQRSEQVLKGTDADVAETVTTALEERGIEILRGTELLRAARADGKKRIQFTHGGQERAVEADEILYALGRKPNLASLALDRAGVTTGKSGVAVNASQQAQAGHIFAAGDVCGPHEVVHIAIQQGELAARNAARLLGRCQSEWETMDYALKLFAVFTHPEVAAVGLSESEAREQGIAIVTAKHPFGDHGKALVRGETQGFVKLLAARETRRILGAACVGPEASELIHEIVVAMHFGASAGDLARIPHYHPTLSEIWTYPAEELAANAGAESVR
jgi:pyruvate/2-oxoglutarate dehydrogenase complex dihydrolipoamide dehydrogenase (E3) component